MRVHEWVGKQSASLAELYDGALDMIDTRRPPGFTRFVAHAGREIGNRLPILVGGRSPTRVQYVNDLDRIADAWERGGLGLTNDPTITGATPETVPDSLSVPRKVVRQIRALLIANRRRDTQDKNVTAMFQAVSPAETPAELIRHAVRRWIEATKGCQERAHDSGTSTDAACDTDALVRHFTVLEELIERMATPVPEQLGGLDEDLDKANT